MNPEEFSDRNIKGEEEEARDLINSVARSPNYIWDLNGEGFP